MNYWCDTNSGLVVKWVDNSVVQIASCAVCIEPVVSLVRRCRKDKTKKQIVLEYNKSIRGIDLDDLMFALYPILCKAKKWHYKVFRCHFVQYDPPEKNIKSHDLPSDRKSIDTDHRWGEVLLLHYRQEKAICFKFNK